MALTKASPPVTEITEMSNGTSNIDIPTAGADIDMNVAGVDILDLATAAITAAVPLNGTTINAENYGIIESGGATGQLQAESGDVRLTTSTVHPLILGANSLLTQLVLNTDGTVALGTTGTLGGQLVDKDYVDTTAGTVAIPATLATNGSMELPVTGGTLGFKWGTENNLNIGANTVVTYPVAFPNATFFVGMTSLNTGGGTQDNVTVLSGTPTATDFTVFHPSGAGSLNDDIMWFAVGF